MSRLRIRTRLRLSYYYGIGALGLRPDDVILASYPRSGNTWVRFFLCNLVEILEGSGRQVTFELVDREMPWLGGTDLREPWPYRTVSRVIKTHNRYWPLFRKNRSILVVRDPRDVMVSFFHYTTSSRALSFRGDFESFVHSRRFGLPAWFRHYQSWKDRSELQMEYEEMRAEPQGAFSEILRFLGASVDTAAIDEALARSSVRRLREAQQTDTDRFAQEFRGGFTFARKGVSRQWEDVFTPDLLEYYAELRRRHRLGRYP